PAQLAPRQYAQLHDQQDDTQQEEHIEEDLQLRISRLSAVLTHLLRQLLIASSSFVQRSSRRADRSAESSSRSLHHDTTPPQEKHRSAAPDRSRRLRMRS